MVTTEKHQCRVENAAKFMEWIKGRGGIAVWQSADLGNPDLSWSTPANSTDGTPTAKPTWQAMEKPERIITDASEIEVCFDKEVKRFRVAIRGNGMQFELTDASRRKVRGETVKAGKGAYHQFDYETQEAIIYAPDKVLTLTEWFGGQI
jgi:hypothetical protein